MYIFGNPLLWATSIMYYVDRSTYMHRHRGLCVVCCGLCTGKIPDCTSTCTRDCAERPYSVDGDIQISESGLQSSLIYTNEVP